METIYQKSSYKPISIVPPLEYIYFLSKQVSAWVSTHNSLMISIVISTLLNLWVQLQRSFVRTISD